MTSPDRLFDPEPFDPDGGSGDGIGLEPGEIVVSIVADVVGLDRPLDYRCPADLASTVGIGDLVRADLGPRRIEGWVVGIDVEPESDRPLKPIRAVASIGPSADVIDLARWAAHRWGGRLAPVLKAASPDRRVKARPGPRPAPAGGGATLADELARLAVAEGDVCQVTVGPGSDRLRFVLAAASLGNTLALVPSVGEASRLAGRLSRMGVRCHLQPGQWAGGFTGGVVVGVRSAVFAPVAELAAVVVLDEHDDAYREERSPTWNARDVAVERARRAGAACLLVSPCPSVAAVEMADRRIGESRSAARRGWPVVDVVDQRDPDPRERGLFRTRTVEAMREAERVVAVLNRKGRAVMLACSACGSLVRTEDGEHLMTEVDGRLVASTGEERPKVCAECASTRLRRLRLGVSRAAEELEALLRRPVVELTATTDRTTIASDAVIMGTSAALFNSPQADVVAFLDFDQELLAPRLRGAAQAMDLLVRGARLCRGRDGGGRLIVQTRDPDHRVVAAAAAADVERFVTAERDIRREAQLPPFCALAEFWGEGAAEFADSLTQWSEEQLDGASTGDGPAAPVGLLGPRPDGHYLVRASGPQALADCLASIPRPRQRLRLVVDPAQA